MGKLLPTCLTLITFAVFVSPTAALAVNDPDITCSTGVLCATGAVLTGHNVGNIRFHSGSTTLWECTSGDFKGTLTKNDGTTVEETIEAVAIGGTGTNGECTGSFGNFTFTTDVGNGTPWCLRAGPAMNADEFQLRGNSCGLESRSVTFALLSTTAGECKYNRTAAIVGSYSTNDSDAQLSVINVSFSLESGGILCAGTGEVDMRMTLEKATIPQTTDPLNIS